VFLLKRHAVRSNLHAMLLGFTAVVDQRNEDTVSAHTGAYRAAHSSTLGVSLVASYATECQQNWKLSGFDSSETRQAAHL